MPCIRTVSLLIQSIYAPYLQICQFWRDKVLAVKVTKTGDGTLRFTEVLYVEIVEGCRPPQLTIGSIVIQPSESTVVQSNEFMMHEGMDGPHNFAVDFRTNAPNNPDLIVNVISDGAP